MDPDTSLDRSITLPDYPATLSPVLIRKPSHELVDEKQN